MLRAAVVGLTEIGAGRTNAPAGWPLNDPSPESHVAAYVAHPETRVVAVCDLNQTLVLQCLTDWADAFDNVRGYADFHELLAREAIDLLSVVTGDDCHAELVVAAAPRVRGLICEKPIATTLADADRMIAAVEAAGIPMSIEHTRRWRPIYHQVRDLLCQQAIGRLRRVIAHLGGPRAMLFRNGTHLIDLVNFLIEAEPSWVFAELDEGFEDYSTYRGEGGRKAAGDPGGSVYVHYDNDVRAFFNASKGTCKGFELELIGYEGEIIIQQDQAELRTKDGTGQLAGRAIAEAAFARRGLLGAVDEMVRLVREGGESVSPPRAGRQALEIILAALESQARGNARVDFPLPRHS